MNFNPTQFSWVPLLPLILKFTCSVSQANWNYVIRFQFGSLEIQFETKWVILSYPFNDLSGAVEDQWNVTLFMSDEQTSHICGQRFQAKTRQVQGKAKLIPLVFEQLWNYFGIMNNYYGIWTIIVRFPDIILANYWKPWRSWTWEKVGTWPCTA